MFKKNKVNLRKLNSLMGKEFRKKRLQTTMKSERLLNKTTDKLDELQKYYDERNKKQKEYQKSREKNILY